MSPTLSNSIIFATNPTRSKRYSYSAKYFQFLSSGYCDNLQHVLAASTIFFNMVILWILALQEAKYLTLPRLVSVLSDWHISRFLVPFFTSIGSKVLYCWLCSVKIPVISVICFQVSRLQEPIFITRFKIIVTIYFMDFVGKNIIYHFCSQILDYNRFKCIIRYMNLASGIKFFPLVCPRNTSSHEFSRFSIVKTECQTTALYVRLKIVEKHVLFDYVRYIINVNLIRPCTKVANVRKGIILQVFQ